MSRSIIVDDNDSGIIYSGAWFKDDSGALDSMGNFGPPMLNTLHGTNSTASFTYTFSGTEFTVTNSNQFNNPTGLNITCLLDNESVPVVISTVPVNNVMLCNKDGLADTEHTFVLQAVVTNQETFWFDFLAYVPSASVPLDKAPLSIGQEDAQLQAGMSAGWKTFSPGFETTQTGAQFTFPFTGVSLTYYGFYDPSLPWDTSIKTAEYSVDGGPPVSFNTQTDVASRTDKPTGVRYNQLLFQTDDLPNGNHTLQVTYQGTNTSTPLTLEFLLVNPNPRDSGAGSTGTTSVVPSSTPSSNAPTVTSSNSTLPSSSPSGGAPKKVSNLGAIVGAVVGAAAVVIVLVVLFILLRRRRKHRHVGQRPTSVLAPEMAEPARPFDPVLTPQPHSAYAYHHPSEAGTSTHAVHDPSMSTSNIDVSSYVARAPSQTNSDPFSDNYYHASADSNSHIQPSPSVQLYGHGPTVELTPHGRVVHSNSDDASLDSRKGRIPMHVANTVVQDEDSGVRLPQGSTGQGHLEILPPSYSKE